VPSSQTSADLLLPLGVALPLLGAALLGAIGRWLPRVAVDALTGVCSLAVVVDLAVLWQRTGGGREVAFLGGWRMTHGETVGIVLAADRVGAGLALLTALLVACVVAYSWRYFEEPPREHMGTFPALLLLFEAGMCGFALTGDLFNAFVFFELMGTAAYALTGYRVEDPRPVQGALIFGVVNSLAAYVSLLGIALLYARTGELGMAQIGARMAQHRPDGLVVVAFVLVITGMLVKGAVAPFHFWLADAHAVAPTPVCMLLSGIMVELGVYGIARVYWTVFGGAGGIPHAAFTRTAVAAGLLTALVGAVMCWQQRHLKRMLAFSTVAHSGLFLTGLALLTPEGATGTLLYIAGHAGTKAALFAVTGVLLDRHGSVDERGLHGRGRDLPIAGILFGVGGFALAGLPPFGLALGKAVSEHAAGDWQPWLPAAFVLVSAATGGTVLRAGLRVFAGAGPADIPDVPCAETTGEGEEPEVTEPRRRPPFPMLAVPALLLAGTLLLGVVPWVWHTVAPAGAAFTDRAGYLAAVYGTAGAGASSPPPPVDWTTEGVLLGVLSATLAAALAAVGVWTPWTHWRDRARTLNRALVVPLRRLHSGHIGDYILWLTLGVAALLIAFTAQR
jgi:multicomponent Na+:H+ antiporter subunit D